MSSFSTLELVPVSPRTHRRKQEEAKRLADIKRLRNNKLRRVQIHSLKLENKGGKAVLNPDLLKSIGSVNLMEPLPPPSQVLKNTSTGPGAAHSNEITLESLSLYMEKGPSLYSAQGRDVSAVRSYLKSFEDDEQTQSLMFPSENESSAGPSVSWANSDEEQYFDRDTRETFHDAEHERGIFGLTETYSKSIVEDTAEVPLKTEHTLDLVEVQEYFESLSKKEYVPPPAYSQTIKALRNAQKAKEHRREVAKQTSESESAPPKKQYIGRVSHIPSNPVLLGFEMDILKHIAWREERVIALKQTYNEMIEVTAKERAEKVTILPEWLVKEPAGHILSLPASSAYLFQKNSNSGGIEKKDIGAIVKAVKKNKKSEEHPEDEVASTHKKKVWTVEDAIRHRKRLIGLQNTFRHTFENVRSATVAVWKCICKWRGYIEKYEAKYCMPKSFPVFDYQGENYVIKMIGDCEAFLGKPKDRRSSLLDTSFTSSTIEALAVMESRQKRDSEDEKSLVRSWIGFALDSNPLLIPPVGLDVSSALQQQYENQRNEALLRKRAMIQSKIRDGLTGDKTAFEIFSSMEEEGEGDSKFEKSRIKRIKQRSVTRSDKDRKTPQKLNGISPLLLPMSARGPAPVRTEEKYSSMPLTARPYPKKVPTPSRPETGNSGTSSRGSSPLYSMRKIDRVKASVSLAIASVSECSIPQSTEDAIRLFELKIQPPTQLVPDLGAELHEHYSKISNEMLQESERIQEWQQQQVDKQHLQETAYDPFGKNFETQLIAVTEGIDLASNQAILRRRQEEGNPHISESDPVRGVGGKPLVESEGLRQCAVTMEQMKQSMQEIYDRDRGKRANVVIELEKLGKDGKKHLKRIANRGQASQKETIQAMLAQTRKRLDFLKKRKYRLGGVLSHRDTEEARELELKYEMLRVGVVPQVRVTPMRRHTTYVDNQAEDGASDERVQAATLLQSHARKELARRVVEQKREDRVVKQSFSLARDDHFEVEIEAAVSIQAKARGFLGRKAAQLEEANLLLEQKEAEIRLKMAEEESALEDTGSIQENELRHRIRKRCREQEELKLLQVKEQAKVAAKRADAARVMSKQTHKYSVRGRTVDKELQELRMKQTRQDKAAIKIQSIVRGRAIRVLFQELQSQERQAQREAQGRKNARERYTKLYGKPDGSWPGARRGSKVGTMTDHIFLMQKSLRCMSSTLPALSIGSHVAPRKPTQDGSPKFDKFPKINKLK